MYIATRDCCLRVNVFRLKLLCHMWFCDRRKESKSLNKRKANNLFNAKRQAWPRILTPFAFRNLTLAVFGHTVSAGSSWNSTKQRVKICFFVKFSRSDHYTKKKKLYGQKPSNNSFFLATIVQESFKNAAYQDWERPKTSQHTNLREQIPEIWVRTKFLKKNMHNMKQDNQHLFTSKLTNHITS